MIRLKKTFDQSRYVENILSVLIITLAYFWVLNLYISKYGIEWSEILRALLAIAVFFGVPGSIISRHFCPVNELNQAARVLFYILIGIPITLLVFYLSNFYEGGLIFWLYLGVASCKFLLYLKNNFSNYLYNNEVKIAKNTERGFLLILLLAFVLLINLNRPILPHKPVIIEGNKTYQHYINHDYLHELSIAQLLIKNNDLEYSFYLGGIKSNLGYYDRSPIGWTFVPFLSKYALLHPAMVFTLIAPTLLLVLLSFSGYLVTFHILKDKYLSYMAFILIACALPMETFLGLEDGFDGGWGTTGWGYDRHSLCLLIEYRTPRYFLSVVFNLLVFYLLLRYSDENDSKKRRLSFLISLILISIFFVKEIIFVGAVLSILLAFSYHALIKREMGYLRGAFLLFVLVMPFTLMHHFLNGETIYNRDGTAVTAQKVNFKVGILTDYYREVYSKHKTKLLNNYTELCVKYLDQKAPYSLLSDIGYVILYDFKRSYGILLFFLGAGILLSFNINIGFSYSGIFVVIMTLFENSLHVIPNDPTDLSRLVDLTANNVYFLHDFAVLAFIVLSGKLYLSIKPRGGSSEP